MASVTRERDPCPTGRRIRHLTFAKEDGRDFAVKLEAGLRHGFRLQSGINPGHHLSLVEAGSVFDDLSRARLKSSFTIGFASDTLLGAFFVGGSVGHRGETRVYFMIGKLVR